jgi:hypothetical protein
MANPQQFRRPAMLKPGYAAQIPGGIDPALKDHSAHLTAGAIVAQGRATTDPEVVARLIHLVEEEGIETVAGLWADSPAVSLPGALWRLYALRLWTQHDTAAAVVWYRLGEGAAQVRHAIAGVAEPPTPESLLALVNEVLSGVYRGDLAVALERAGAYARVLATGMALDADSRDLVDRQAGSALTGSAANLQRTAHDLEQAAALWRSGELE